MLPHGLAAELAGRLGARRAATAARGIVCAATGGRGFAHNGLGAHVAVGPACRMESCRIPRVKKGVQLLMD